MKRFIVIVSFAIVLGVMLAGIFARVNAPPQEVNVKSDDNAVYAMQQVQNYTLQSGKFAGKTIESVMYERFSSATAFGIIGWKAIKASNGNYMVGYDLKDKETNSTLSYIFYFTDGKVYTLNGLAIGMCGKEIKYTGKDASTLINEYSNE